MAPILFWGN